MGNKILNDTFCQEFEEVFKISYKTFMSQDLKDKQKTLRYYQDLYNGYIYYNGKIKIKDLTINGLTYPDILSYLEIHIMRPDAEDLDDAQMLYLSLKMALPDVTDVMDNYVNWINSPGALMFIQNKIVSEPFMSKRIRFKSIYKEFTKQKFQIKHGDEEKVFNLFLSKTLVHFIKNNLNKITVTMMKSIKTEGHEFHPLFIMQLNNITRY